MDPFEQADRVLRRKWQIGDVVVFKNFQGKPTGRVTSVAYGSDDSVCFQFSNEHCSTWVWYTADELLALDVHPPL